MVSFAKFKETSDDTMNISDVYTRSEYRGQKLAKKVVNAIKNEIIEKGKIATLNVDQKNPISNHVYQSLGFKKVFSQTEYRKVNK
ncbi:GNAT family N-acetyltransferase [Helcococcus kunzii]|nr:GNAT family N-acetyltransferase [Helcococcus kunzii]MCT1988354.1 GNAT family N-acetyltransferase [Helcococcus kunzii]